MKQNDILKIGTFSILCYLILRVSHFILIKLLLLLNLKFQIENEIILLTLNGIITGVLPIIVLIISINKSILKSIIPTFKTIFSLFIVLIVLTFIREGTDIYRNQYMKIGISSVLCYTVFEKVYLILTSILTWIYTLLKIENEFIILGINVLFGFLSIIILVSIYNRILKNKIPSKKSILLLLSVCILLVFLVGGNTFLISEYIVNRPESEFIKYNFITQFDWTNELNYLVRFLGLSYFIWKLYTERKTVANKELR